MAKNRYLNSLITATLSIAPVFVIVAILSLIGLAPLDFNRGDYLLLVIGMFVLILGLTIFQIGAPRSLTKVGEYMGSSLAKQKNIFIVCLFAFALGALIAVAEPSIMILAKQVNIDRYLLIGGIALGVGIFVVVGVLRIIFHKSLKILYLFFYAITFMLLIFVAMDPSKASFLPFIFDSGGVTTGSATVPFILSLGAGIAIVRGGKNAQNDSFGLVGIAAIGPIFTIAILIALAPVDGNYVPSYTSMEEATNNIFMTFMNVLLPNTSTGEFVMGTSLEVAVAIAPTLIIFLIYNFIFIHLPAKKIKSLLLGFLYVYIGLSIFLCGTSSTMTPIGYFVGYCLGEHAKWIIILVSFIIGLVAILCEPAVHVLTIQMEEVSDGSVKKSTVLLTLSLGVGVAIALAVIRALFNFSIMYYLVPGYIVSLSLMFFCPDIFTAMAFDSGGTASGPVASSFVLPMVVGITKSVYGESADFYSQSFGVIALITLTPIIAIQILGVTQKIKSAYAAHYMSRLLTISKDDAQIIHF